MHRRCTLDRLEIKVRRYAVDDAMLRPVDAICGLELQSSPSQHADVDRTREQAFPQGLTGVSWRR